jgi:radical SAM protein with 4Fe4S-binding SPASM domain
LDADIVLLYQLVSQGRGSEDDLEISREEYADLMKLVSKRQKRCNPIIEPTCSPQYFPYLLRKNGTNLGTWFSSKLFKGCTAGRGICYIKPDGEVWACPFIPISVGNVRNTPLKEIWDKAELFQTLRDRKNLHGKCGTCPYNELCGGCRGRAYSYFGDYLAEDPHCFLQSTASG